MQANTKQVRSVMRNAIVLHRAQTQYNWSWTDKTTIEDTARRSVVFNVRDSKMDAVLATVQAEFAKLGYTNKLKVTCGNYLRCIADLA